MRLTTKYKYYNILNFFKTESSRILKFKRPKWKKLQALIKAKTKQNLINNFSHRSLYKNFERIGNTYKNGLQTSRLLYLMFQIKSSLLLKKNKTSKPFLKKNLIDSVVLKPLYMLKILLWKLNLFKSSFEVSQKIDNGYILVNNLKKSSNYILKKGDIISFNNLPDHKNDLIFKNNTLLYSFLELDFYTGNLIIIKESPSFIEEDYFFICSEYLDIKTLVDYNLK